MRVIQDSRPDLKCKRRLFIAVLLVAASAGLATLGCAKRESAERAAPATSSPADREVTKVPYEVWRDEAQGHETLCWSEGEDECRPYKEMSRWTMQRFYFRKDEFRDKVVVDIGCGPTGLLDWLEGSFIAIEPLASTYRKLPWAHLEKYHKFYEQPGEKRIDELVGKVDMIFSINCFDHAYDVEAIIENMAAYLKPDGRAFVSVDLDKPPDPAHPLVVRPETMRSMFLKHGFTIEREEQGNVADPGTGTGKVVLDRTAWSGGTAYHWWLGNATSR